MAEAPPGLGGDLPRVSKSEVNERIFFLSEAGRHLDLGEGTNHVHIDWTRVSRAEVGISRGEGALTLFDGRIIGSDGNPISLWFFL